MAYQNSNRDIFLTWDYFLRNKFKRLSEKDFDLFKGNFWGANILRAHSKYILDLVHSLNIESIGTSPIFHYIGESPSEPVVFMGFEDNSARYTFHTKSPALNRLQAIKFFCERDFAQRIQRRIEEIYGDSGWREFIFK